MSGYSQLSRVWLLIKVAQVKLDLLVAFGKHGFDHTITGFKELCAQEIQVLLNRVVV